MDISWRSVEWCGDHIKVVDQTLLPERFEFRELRTVDDVIDAISRLVVRGAPAIGVCGAYGLVLGLDAGLPIGPTSNRIAAARPTAVNLTFALGRVLVAAGPGVSREDARRLALEAAHRLKDEDEASCRRIGEYGRQELTNAKRVLTHCNTGRLATAGLGTALGVVYAKAQAGDAIEVTATETRPLLQGSRLTAWELANAGIPVTLIADTAAGATLSSGRVDAVIVGCDRVARNGDTANKVGTYNLAVLARASGVPFYVAGPMSSFDPETPDGGHIVVEERAADEVRRVGDARLAPDVDVWNPAFDITPADLITAFITDEGVIRPPYAFG